MGFIRLILLGFVGLSVLYFLISIYSRSIRREKLEKSWDADPTTGDDMAARDTYINEGMAEYENGFRKKLIILVYVIPPLFVATILYLTNTQ